MEIHQRGRTHKGQPTVLSINIDMETHPIEVLTNSDNMVSVNGKQKQMYDIFVEGSWWGLGYVFWGIKAYDA